jgi:hypothetical protein
MNDFSTLENILTNPRFPIEVDLYLGGLSLHREEVLRKANEENFKNKSLIPAKLKRSPYDVLESRHLTDSTTLIPEFRKVVDKTTTLSSTVRDYISEIMRHSAQQMILYYHAQADALAKAEAAAAAKPKKPRAKKTTTPKIKES